MFLYCGLAINSVELFVINNVAAMATITPSRPDSKSFRVCEFSYIGLQYTRWLSRIKHQDWQVRSPSPPSFAARLETPYLASLRNLALSNQYLLANRQPQMATRQQRSRVIIQTLIALIMRNTIIAFGALE